MNNILNGKFVKKYMRQARLIGTDSNPCQSRQIGVIIVDPDDNVVVGQGYNGPPAGVPHNTSTSSLKNFFWPQLTDEQKEQVCEKVRMTDKMIVANGGKPCHNLDQKEDLHVSAEFFARRAPCDVCPRRLVNAGSGIAPNLCSCQHAERNAITKATRKLTGCIMFCWCGVPCIQCTGSIINAGIKVVHCLVAEDYEPQARYLFDKANVRLHEHEESSF